MDAKNFDNKVSFMKKRIHIQNESKRHILSRILIGIRKLSNKIRTNNNTIFIY